VTDSNTIALNAVASLGICDLMNERIKGETSISGDGPAVGGRIFRFPRGGRLLGPLFGLVFLIYPIRAVLTSNPTPARVFFALGGAALFVGVFLWLMWMQEPLWSASAEPSEVRKRRATIAFLAVLALALNLALGTEWRVLFFHVNVAAGIMLLTRDAYVAIAGLAATTLALGFVSGMAWLALPTAAIGLWATAFVRQVAAVAELRSAREELARLAVSEERLRFARDLHDLLGHSLSLITLKSELAGRLLPAEPEKAATEVHDIEGVARQALSEVREAVAGYRRPTLVQELAGASEILEAAGITCQIVNEAGVLPNAVEAVLAWAVREGTTNVIRHSRAGHCRIVLARDGAEIYVEMTDDGRGYQKENGEVSGSGLSGLTERIATFAGFVEAGSPPDGGFRLRVGLPARSDAERPAWPEPKLDDTFTGEHGRR
jgi:two-component system, NarL family, sensor histidine kinase DesK